MVGLSFGGPAPGRPKRPVLPLGGDAKGVLGLSFGDDELNAGFGEQGVGNGAGGSASVNSVSTCSSRPSSTIAGRLNLLWSAASHTSRECRVIACATFTSR